MRHGHRTGLDLVAKPKPTAPVTSYWTAPDMTRDQLNAAIAGRRSQQRLPTEAELQHDPATSATASLAQDHPAWTK